MERHGAWQMFMGLLLLFIVGVISYKAGDLVVTENQKTKSSKEKYLVVIDAGHDTSHLCNYEMCHSF